MKTTTKLISSLLLFLCLLAVSSLRAQLANPYPVFNTSDCSIDIDYQIYKGQGSCTPCTAIGGSGTITVSTTMPGFISIPSGCPAFCDISITVTTVDGFTLGTPITVSSGSSSGPVFGSSGSANCPTFSLSWGAGGASFN